MDDNKLEKTHLTEVVTKNDKLPDEVPSLHIEAKFKISDPETGTVIVEGRS